MSKRFHIVRLFAAKTLTGKEEQKYRKELNALNRLNSV